MVNCIRNGFMLLTLAILVVVLLGSYSHSQPVQALQTVTKFSTGERASKMKFFLTKQLFLPPMLSLHTRLPKKGRGELNSTFVMKEIDPTMTKQCNTSSMMDICLQVQSAVGILSSQTEVMPRFWTSLIYIVVASGSDAIRHFSMYGCFGNFALPFTGIHVNIIDDGLCPEFQTNATQVSLLAHARTLKDSDSDGSENVRNCWGVVYSKHFIFSGDAWSVCLAENPVIEGAYIYGLYRAVKYTPKWSEIEGLKKTKSDMESLVRNAQSEWRKVMAKVRTNERELENLSEEHYVRNMFYERGKVEGQEIVKDEIAQLNEEFKRFHEIAEDLRKDAERYDEIFAKNQRVKAEIERYKPYQFERNLRRVKPTRVITYEHGESTVTKAEDYEREVHSALNSCQPYFPMSTLDYDPFEKDLPITPLGVNFGKCEMELSKVNDGNQKIRLAGQADNGMVSGPDVEQKFVQSSEELANMGKYVETSESATLNAEKDVVGKGLAESLLGTGFGVVLGSVGEMVNMMWMFGMMQDMIDKAVSSIENNLDTQFNITFDRLRQLSEQEKQQYDALINTIDHEVSLITEKLQCDTSWRAFRDHFNTVNTMYEYMTDNYMNCNLTRKLEGYEYVKCEHENMMAKGVDTSQWSTLLEFANAAPHQDWEHSVIGEYLQHCLKEKTLSGESPSFLGRFASYSLQVARAAMLKTSMVYRWSVAMDQAYQNYQYNASIVDNSVRLNQSFAISGALMTDMTSWFLGSVLPPALSDFVDISIWNSINAVPPSSLYFQVEILNGTDSTFPSLGFLSPSVWIAESYMPNTGIEHIIEEHSDLRKTLLDSDSAPKFDPPAWEQIKVHNVTNATETLNSLALDILCVYFACQTRVDLISCENQADSKQTCNYIRYFNTTQHMPARGWAGPVPQTAHNDTRLCSADQVEESEVCNPGLRLLRKNKLTDDPSLPENNQIQLWANLSVSLHMPDPSQYEYQKILSRNISENSSKRTASQYMFQMWEDDWGFKYGTPHVTSYLEKYFKEVPYYLTNLNGYLSNVSALTDGDGWRYYWGIQSLGHVQLAKIDFADTNPTTNSSYGFSCPMFLHGDISSCALELVKEDYPLKF
eukprot:Nk52_evm12s2415 gene=Nk52_evmTU12s2415